MRKRLKIRKGKPSWQLSNDASWKLLKLLCQAQWKGINEVMRVASPHINHLDQHHLDVIISSQTLTQEEVLANRPFLLRVMRQVKRRKICFNSMIPSFRFSILDSLLFPVTQS